ncbi:hypothetical protein B0A58_08625 [Flavobacterium branchiophilum NBRC 15030 = ATCC 35035]|uniref:Uncharacterized protein DUF4230 n=1 Tax=Flavobacterium branchiophilum TaxID=55197 RepID=A0A543G6J4_9FLAO|nr:DUF4230 domain-containing protein [Flavobacterium branchiophilum]OXA75639.1 hypothetical protein B0A58_08625 [Flavobacterium branchiophilum NBRC 15030 = ATCC 35035]TQM41702.1 uncharacterized protein DUF4230 [Flavobacterium branchiophilum]GEM55471.1 hypothetical protein FB1_16920 [Flavobacterium branchiophilum NBRC 15030 = ATCC 35035]
MLRRILYAVVGILIIILLFKFCEFKKTDSSTFDDSAKLLQQKNVNVGKLVVTEGHFSEVITYKDQKKYLMDLVSFEKKALIVVNADVTVSYDLHLMKYDINNETKTITIVSIPKEEIKINPNIQFYDVDQSTLNPFSGDDYNKISESVKASLSKKVAQSTLKSNAQNRLISELSKILIMSNAMGWKLQYQGNTINENTLQKVIN